MVSGEKRNCEGENAFEKTAAILLDIEGTTTSISFVKETLFGYVRENLKAYVDSHWNDDELKEDLKALKLLCKKDEEDKVENFCPIEEGENEKESLVKNVLWQMDLDKKTTALKQLQGHIWREGYEKGKLKGQVYSDVPQVLKKWCEDDRKLYVYSSGSVEAQKLLFKNSEAGDLEAYITGHFDTEIGQKTDASSYTNIAKAVGFDSKQILFLTDSVKEAVAADKAGLQVTIVVRDGNAPLTDDEKKAFNVVTSLKDLVFESCNKKKKICENEQDLKENSKAENVENSEEVAAKTEEIENGKAEKMEVEMNEEKPDSTSNCSGENPEEKNEGEKVSAQPDNKGESDPENQNQNVESEKSEASVQQEETSEAKPEEVASNGEPETKKDAEEGAKEVENSSEKGADSTESVPVTSGNATDNEKTQSSDEKPTEKTEPEGTTEEGKDSKEEMKSVNGHKKNETEVNETNGGEKTCEEVNGKSEVDDKMEKNEVSESVPLKKMEEQADSTVEVTA